MKINSNEIIFLVIIQKQNAKSGLNLTKLGWKCSYKIRKIKFREIIFVLQIHKNKFPQNKMYVPRGK